MATPMASVSGIASGIDTATLVSQLMYLEAAPQRALQTRLTSEQSKLSVMQNINSRVASLATLAADLATPAKWTPFQATSSSTDVTVTTTVSAAPTNVSFTVDQVASAHRLTFTDATALDAAVPASISLTTASGTTALALDDPPTVQGLIDALNNSGEVRASAVRLDNGTYRLSVESTTTGADSAFSLTALDGAGDPVDLLGGTTITRTGTDARITVGTDQIHSSTNTFAGVLPGVDVTISAAAVGTTVDVTVARDASAAAEKAKSLVDALNGALAEIRKQSTYNAASSTSGPLTGNYTFRTLSSSLLNTVFPSDNSTLAAFGIELDRNGNVTFDQAAFTSAYAADPTALTAALGGTDGFASRVQSVAEAASGTNGYVTSLVTGQNDSIKRLQTSIDSWDIRLEKREMTLRAQFTAMETAMSRLQSQSSWLASQLASMTTTSSN